jgi:hypothetical protein
MNGVILPKKSVLKSMRQWRSPEFIAKEQEAKDRKTRVRRIEQAHAWEMDLRSQLRAVHRTSPEATKLRQLIKDAQFCQGSMFSVPRGKAHWGPFD